MGTRLQAMIEENFDHYRGLFNRASYYQTQIALDVHGYTHPATHKLLKALAHHEASRSEGVKSFSYCLRRWRQLLSVTMQREVSSIVDRGWSGSVAQPGSNFAVDRYRRRDFLLTPASG